MSDSRVWSKCPACGNVHNAKAKGEKCARGCGTDTVPLNHPACQKIPRNGYGKGAATKRIEEVKP